MSSSMAFIELVFTENTGGGCMVDFIKLKDGRYLCISDEVVMLYKNLEEFYEATPEDKPFIEL